MKHLMKYQLFQIALTVVLLAITQGINAQDNSSTTTSTHTSTTTETWYVPIWGWIAGGVVLLIIIIALISRGRTDKVIIKKSE